MPSTSFTRSNITALALLATTVSAAAAPELVNCQPDPNCGSRDKPCYMQISQRVGNVILRGSDSLRGPTIPKSAIRVRICTQVDRVCKAAEPDQRLNVFVFDKGGNPIYSKSLVGSSGPTDTGSFTSVGPHAFFGVSCFTGDKPCRIAWQHCHIRSKPNETM